MISACDIDHDGKISHEVYIRMTGAMVSSTATKTGLRARLGASNQAATEQEHRQ